jgi:DNA-binding MarR family transcriptional regulator
MHTSDDAMSAGGGPTTARLRLVLVRLARRLRQQAGADATPTQLAALSTIGRHEPLRLSLLASKERIGRSTVTRLASNLEGRGYIRRYPDATDGRSQLVALTPSGRELLASADARADSYLTGRLATLTEAERRTLLDALPVMERLLGMQA